MSIMKKGSIRFLQAVTVLIGMAALAILIRLPLTEGRAQGLDLFSIYSDPLILYGYVSSIALFVALYEAFKLLGNIGQNKLFTLPSLKILRIIKYCAVIFSMLVVTGGLYMMLFYNKEEDITGILSMCIVVTFIAIASATALAVLEKALQNAVDIKSEHDLTI